MSIIKWAPRPRRAVIARAGVIAAAVLASLGVSIGLTLGLTGAFTPNTDDATGATSSPAAQKRVDPQLQADRDAAGVVVAQLMPLANSATGVASSSSIAALQADLADLDVASQAGTESDVAQSTAATQVSFGVFALNAAETCEARLAVQAPDSEWATRAAPNCAELRTALQSGADTVPALVNLVASGTPE